MCLKFNRVNYIVSGKRRDHFWPWSMIDRRQINLGWYAKKTSDVTSVIASLNLDGGIVIALDLELRSRSRSNYYWY